MTATLSGRSCNITSKNKLTLPANIRRFNRRIHHHVAAWLDAVTADSDPIVTWLETTLAGRSPFLGPNLLTAGLHQCVLADDPAVADLATFYPGSPHFGRASYRFDTVLREAILATRTTLAPFMQTANVQTNETSRGFTWLWPLHYVGWESVHLLDLGASAGLNLVAPLRRYEVTDVAGRSLMRLGSWPDEKARPQFRIRGPGADSRSPAGRPQAAAAYFEPDRRRYAAVLSRFARKGANIAFLHLGGSAGADEPAA